MDIVTYALAKKMASSVASGITEIETNGTTIRFKTTSGDWFTVTLNSISEVSVSANGHLIVKLSDGTQIDCGALPVGTMDSSLSTTSENGVQNKVITNALNGKQNTLVQGSGITIDTTDPTHPQISANIDYTNLTNKPTKLSDFTNDENFITNTANNLSNYYLKTETYTQSEVNDLISQLASLSVEIVESLPTTDISTTTIYLMNVSGTNNYNQWMYINNAWANIGSTSVDLTNYYTKTQVNTLLNDKVDKVSGKGLSTNDFTNAYKSTLDNYSVDSTLDSTSTNPIQNAVVTQALDAKQPKTLSSPITIGGTSQTTVEGALGGLNSLCGTKLTMVTSLPLSPSNQETVLYIGNSSGDLLCGGIYQYQVSEWVMISNVSSFTFNSDEFTVDSTTNEVSLKPSYADIPSFLPNNVSSSNKLATMNKLEEKVDKDLANATGTLPVANGGTGATTTRAALNSFIESLPVGTDVPEDDNYYVTQDSSGGASYVRRSISKLWDYIKGKISSVLGLTATNYGGTASKATNDGNGNNIADTYALKSNLQYIKSINLVKADDSSDTWYYLIAETPGFNVSGNIESLFVQGSDYKNRMFEGSIKTREGNIVFNYGKDNLPIELYEQTDGTIYVYWLVDDAFNSVALNITATLNTETYGGYLSPVTPTGSKMTLTEYDFKIGSQSVIISLEQRVTALESKLQKASN